MRLSCPSCGFAGDAEAFLADAEAARAVLAALRVPSALAAPLQQYLRLFRPPERALQARRLAALLDGLLPDIERAQIERNGRACAAPVGYWVEALDVVVAKRAELTLPLKSHGYLYEVIAGIAHRAEGRSERKAEAARAGAVSGFRSAQGPTPIAAHAPAAVATAAPILDASPAPAPAPEERAPMPQAARAMIDHILGRRPGAGKEGES